MIRLLIGCFLFILVVGGCGNRNVPDLFAISGSVTLDGQPLQTANIQFIPDGAVRGSGGIGASDASGRYQLRTGQGYAGIPAGEYRVIVEKYRMPDGSEFPADSQVGPIQAGAVQFLPAKYSDRHETQLRATVSGDVDGLDFALESEP